MQTTTTSAGRNERNIYILQRYTCRTATPPPAPQTRDAARARLDAVRQMRRMADDPNSAGRLHTGHAVNVQYHGVTNGPPDGSSSTGSSSTTTMQDERHAVICRALSGIGADVAAGHIVYSAEQYRAMRHAGRATDNTTSATTCTGSTNAGRPARRARSPFDTTDTQNVVIWRLPRMIRTGSNSSRLTPGMSFDAWLMACGYFDVPQDATTDKRHRTKIDTI